MRRCGQKEGKQRKHSRCGSSDHWCKRVWRIEGPAKKLKDDVIEV